jgi:nickel-dependent lactate racemase
MEKIKLEYGSYPLEIEKPKNTVEILHPNPVEGVKDVHEEFRKALKNPIGTKQISEIVKGKKRIAIVVSDRTRIYPKKEMIEALLEELKGIPDENITIVIANGNHPVDERSLHHLGEEICKRFRIVQHNSMDESNLIHIGKTSRGTEVWVNKEVAEADVKILIGHIKPHYFTGYSGGAKSLLPGVCGFYTIANNHIMKPLPNARLGIVDGNPIREDMEEAGRMAGIDFIFNVVMNGKKEVVKAVAGDLVKAHREGVVWARKVCEVKTQKLAKICIVSDGVPTSINLYQASKLVPPAGKTLNGDSGVVIVCAECNEGYGSSLNVINEMIYRIGLTNYLPEKHQIFLVSSLREEEVKETFCRYASSLEEALHLAYEIVGKDAPVSIIPKGGLILPI